MREIMIIDTSILCVWLDVPGMETCGPANNFWDKRKVTEILEAEEEKNTLFVLPLAVIIETGNHIAQSQNAWVCANALCEIIRKSLDSTSPWAEFSQQDALWNSVNLHKLINDWPALAQTKLSIGDMTIKTVAEFYAEARYNVRILTGDEGLKAYEPMAVALVPRRYKDKDNRL